MNTEAKFDSIIQMLEHVRMRPGMFLFNPDAFAAMNFLGGFNGACYLFLSIDDPNDTYRQIAVERGWNYPEKFIIPAMRERGLDENAMIEELFTIMIEVWKRWKDAAISDDDSLDSP